MDEKTMKRIITGLLMAVTISIPLGCSVDRWAEVEPGEYMAIDVHNESNGATISGIETLLVQREANTIAIKFQDGSQLVTMFVTRKSNTGQPAAHPILGQPELRLSTFKIITYQSQG